MAAPALKVAAEVAAALAAGRAVVALESTLVAHGLPYPVNLETAQAADSAIREAGAIPATVAVWDGRLCVGLEPAQIEILAREGGSVPKLSTRDLAEAVRSKGRGATTVAATARAASMAGVRVFATGGIGGVHRDAELSFDISADLLELRRTPVVVVCSGAKSILDIPRTLELLETLAIPVVGYRSDDFPAFYARSSGLPSPLRLDAAEDIASLADAHWNGLGQAGGILVANPVPGSEAIRAATLEAWTEEATRAAAKQGIVGKAVTPFLLRELARRSDGATLAANASLVRGNARLAAEIANALPTRGRGVGISSANG